MAYFAKILGVLPLIFLVSLDSSKTTQDNNPVIVNVYSYEDISEKAIKWADVFQITPYHYYVYFYSPYCGHCQSIKDLVINYSVCGEIPMFFVEANNEVVTSKDTHLTIGATSIEQLWILGYPSLVEIESGVVIANTAGANAIQEILLI
jgi:thiol-disulfide isomerase/thioredoxin